jgi:ABC-type phosphate transport system permease subunit
MTWLLWMLLGAWLIGMPLGVLMALEVSNREKQSKLLDEYRQAYSELLAEYHKAKGYK